MTHRRLRFATIATSALVVGTVGTGVMAWAMVDSLDDSLSQANTSLQAVDQTLEVTETLLIDTADALALLETTLVNVEAATTSSTTAIEDASTLAADVPQNLRDIQTGLAQTQAAAATIDEVTAQLASVPLLGSGIQATNLAPTITALSLNLDPLIVGLDDSSTSLSAVADDAARLSEDLPALRAQVSLLLKRSR
ncbi:MAG: hypothetical protein R2706_03085 [Acidimicrobiales bacterium]